MMKFALSNDRFLLSSVFGEWALVAQQAREEMDKLAMQEAARLEKMGQAKACLFRRADAADSALLHMVFVQFQHQCALAKAARDPSSRLSALQEQSLEAQSRHLRVLFATGDAALMRVYFDAFKETARMVKRIHKQEGLMKKFAASVDSMQLSSVFSEWFQQTRQAKVDLALLQQANLEKMGKAKQSLFRMADAADSALLHMVFVQLQHQCALSKAERDASSRLNSLHRKSLDAQSKHLRALFATGDAAMM